MIIGQHLGDENGVHVPQGGRQAGQGEARSKPALGLAAQVLEQRIEPPGGNSAEQACKRLAAQAAMVVSHRLLELQRTQQDAGLVGQFLLPGLAEAACQFQTHSKPLLGRPFLVLGFRRQQEHSSHALVLEKIEDLVGGDQAFEPIFARIFPVRFRVRCQERDDLEIQGFQVLDQGIVLRHMWIAGSIDDVAELDVVRGGSRRTGGLTHNPARQKSEKKKEPQNHPTSCHESSLMIVFPLALGDGISSSGANARKQVCHDRTGNVDSHPPWQFRKLTTQGKKRHNTYNACPG